MVARRALIEDQAVEPIEPSLISFQAAPARRALIEDDLQISVLNTVATESRIVNAPVSFDADDSLLTTQVLPKISDRIAQTSKVTRARIRRTVAALAAAVTTGGVFVIPNTVNAAPEPADQAVVADRQASVVSRDAVRTAVDADPIVKPMTEANAALAGKQVAAEATFQAQTEQRAAEIAAEEEARRQREEEARRQREAEEAAAAARQRQAQAAAQTVAVRQQLPAVDAHASGAAAGALSFALAQVGKPYSWGAVGPNAFDCSGLMVAAYRTAGIGLPRTSYAMLNAGVPVSLSDIQPGDLVITYGAGHVGMYIGGGQMVHAADYGIGVIISPLPGGINGIRRVA